MEQFFLFTPTFSSVYSYGPLEYQKPVFMSVQDVYIICLSVFCYHVRRPNFPSKEFDCMFEAFSISERTVKKKMSEDLIYGK